MYGSKEKSWPQRFVILIGQCTLLILVYWFLFLEGNSVFRLPAGDLYRDVVLFACCLFTFFRMSYMTFFLLERGIRWSEIGGILFAFASYYIGFSVLGGIQGKPLDGFDIFAAAVFVAGGIINTLSEQLRKQWKKDKQNKGKLYTGGLFQYAMHINYFGDIVWVTGFALLTRSIWSGFIPVFLILMFVFLNIPAHDRYLREKYGHDFAAYEKRTKKLIPFIY